VGHPKSPDYASMLKSLIEHEIEFIVIGGYAAIVHGGPMPTLDLDIVRNRTPENILKMLRFMEQADAVTRLDSRRLRFNESHLVGKGALLMSTNFGPLDMLGTVGDGRGYDELLPHTELFDIGGLAVRVLDLPTLIEIKAAAGRDKDKLAVAHLSRILAARSNPSS
jgi:predicted nucleotidyltransferase